MKHHRAADLVKILAPSLARSGGEDLIYLWLEEGVGAIRERPWPWNWSETAALTKASFAQSIPPVTYTWTEGDTYVVSSVALTLSKEYTGRWVKLGDEWYRTTDIGLSSTTRMYVDRQIRGSETTGIALSLYRMDLAVRTTRIRRVSLNGAKIDRVSPEYWTSHFNGIVWQAQSPSTPYCYTDIDDPKWITKPLHPPTVTTTAVAASMPPGRYFYFFTKVDRESGLESPPGPMATYDAAGGFSHTVVYGNTTDSSEDQSYYMKLYRSDVNPTRDRCAMYLIQSRTPDVPGTPFTDTITSVRGKLRFWDGPLTVLQFYPMPDDTRCSIQVSHVNNWSVRVADDDQIELGSDNTLMELLRIYMAGSQGLAARSPEEHRKALIQFRQQLNYLITTSRSAGHTDEGPENTRPLSGSSDDEGDWVEYLAWKY